MQMFQEIVNCQQKFDDYIGCTGVRFVGQNETQSRNTELFLQLVAGRFSPEIDEKERILIAQSHICRKNVYKRGKDKKYILDEAGEKILLREAGKGWTNPAIFDLARPHELLGEHFFPFAHTVKGRKVHDKRNSLAVTLATEATEDQKFLFYPCSVKMRSLFQGGKQKNFTSDDICRARFVWVDVDGHGETSPFVQDLAVDTLMEILPSYCEKTEVPMPAVVSSGRGVHLYWPLRYPVELSSVEDRKWFRKVLVGAAKWAGKLLELDDTLSSVWESDTAACQTWHQMNLPGTIHPKMKTPRYVVNEYDKDYDACYFDTLAEVFVPDLVYPVASPDSEPEPDPTIWDWDQLPPPEDWETHSLPTEDFIPVVATSSEVAVATAIPASFARPAYAGSRLSRLQAWAASHDGEVDKRHVYLIICASLIIMARGDLKELHTINHGMANPLPHSEVERTIAEVVEKQKDAVQLYGDAAAAWDKWYCYSNLGIKDALGMSEADAKRFGFDGSTPSTAFDGAYHPPAKAAFTEQLHRIYAETPREEGESSKAWHARCYELAKAWAKENGPKDRHQARTRKRAAARAEKAAADAALALKVQAMHAEGRSLRAISAELGVDRRKVTRLLTPP